MATTTPPKAADSGTPATRAPAFGRAVIWIGLALGTAATVLAVTNGIRIPGLEVVLSVAATWVLLIVLAVVAAGLVRRHHRAVARHAYRHGRRGVLAARRRGRAGTGYLASKAADRWQDRQHRPLMFARTSEPASQAQPEPGPGPAAGESLPFPVLLTARSKSGRSLNPVTGEPVNTATVYDPDDLQRRLAAAAADPDIEVSTRPIGPIDQNSNATEGTPTMADTTVVDDGSADQAAQTRTRGRRRTGTFSAAWKQVIADTAEFEPEDDAHLLAWMAAEVNSMSAYAEALTEVYETCVSTVGLDPVAMKATHDVADAAAEAASVMATARQKFASHYGEVREFAANGGLLPFDGRWITGDGDA